MPRTFRPLATGLWALLPLLATLSSLGCSRGGGEKADGAMPDPSRAPDAGRVLREVQDASLRIQVLQEGTGEEAKAGDVVDLRFKGYLPDGKQFEEGFMTGNVLGTPRRDVPRAVDRAALGMKVGEKRRVAMPGSWGYDARATPSGVRPGTGLVLDLERVPLFQVATTDLRDSAGREAKVGDKITVHYKGTLTEGGKVFDSSYTSEKKEPLTRELSRGQLIEGWIRGIPGMRVGGMRLLRIPWQVAYGEKGRPPKIPPRADLTFQVELLEIK